MLKDTSKTIETNKLMLAKPNNLFSRLNSIPTKRFDEDFKANVSRLQRPYYRLSEADYEAVRALSKESDVLLFDGKTQVTFGVADGGYALMPLSRPI